jgi:hypothetical protein
VVPIFQERGVFRSDYAGPTLREQLELGPVPRASAEPAAV